jgi:hypothetical protein
MRIAAVIFGLIALALVVTAFQLSGMRLLSNLLIGVAIFFSLFAINCWRPHSNDRTSDEPLHQWFQFWRWWR